MNDILTAIILITGTPGQPEPVPTEDAFPSIREAVHKVAIEMEILDDRETSYIFAKRSDFDADLNMLRRRWHELKDSPRIADSERLPPRDWVVRMCAFNRDYRRHLEDRRCLEQDRDDILGAAIVECDECYRLWDGLRDARCPYFYVSVRRHALARVRDALGEEDWAAVRIPPPVPTWRFSE